MTKLFSTKFLFVLLAAFSLTLAPTFAPGQFHELSIGYSIAHAGDRDHDGHDDTVDAFPDDSSEHADHDHDGEGDNADHDDDNDGYSDDVENQVGTDPEDENSVPADLDGDGIPDALDPDIDGDGIPNAQDMNPTDPAIGADTTAPVITPPANITVEATGAATTVVLGTATATDNFDPTVTVTNNAPATFPVGVTTVTYTATDAAGNVGTATQTVTVTDTTAPTVTAPAAATAEATGTNTTVTLGAATASDLVDGSVIVTSDAPASFPVGITTVTYSATDAAGNIGTATQTVTITDTTAPVVTAPAAVTASSGDNLPVSVTLGTATATDLVDGTVIVTNDAPASFPVGTTTVTYTATDAAGNIGTATQLVTVNLVDVTAPVVTAPAAVTTNATGVTTPVTLGTATATDIVDGAIVPTSDAPASFPVGTTMVTYTATDAAGNTATATQSVTVTAVTSVPALPLFGGGSAAITVPAGSTLFNVSADPVVVGPVGFSFPVGSISYSVTSPVGGSVTTSISFSAPLPSSFVLLKTDGVTYQSIPQALWTVTGPNSVAITLTDGGPFDLDGMANGVIVDPIVVAVDTLPPVITAPADITASSGDNLPVAVTLGVATATDAVDGTVAVTSDAPATFPVGTTTVTYSATDVAGNTATATQLVTVNLVDVTAPVVTAPAAVTAEATGVSTTVVLGTATATDVVDGVLTTTNDAPASFPVGVTTVTYTATDAAGNVGTATQLVTVNLIDTVAPVITVPANVYTSTSTSQATVDIGMATATDNVDGIVAVTNNAPATFPIGVTTVTWTSSDSAGNTATATQNIYVSYSSTVGGGSGGTTTPPPAGGGATVTSEAVYWHHNDHLGTPQAMTDINGTKVWEMSQTPFGIATVNEDPDGDGITVTNNFRFPGQYFDAESGLFYNYFRSYDPERGAYPQSDPIGLRGGMNTYVYVDSDPVNWFDPWGLLKYNTKDTSRTGRLTGETLKFAECFETCAGFELTVTGGSEKKYHGAGSKHYTGQACDFSKKRNPKLDGSTSKKCFKKCSKKGYLGQEEGGKQPHYHFQIVPGKNNSTGYLPGVR